MSRIDGDGTSPDSPALPDALREVIAEFDDTPAEDRLSLLLEFSDELPDLPERYAEHPELLEPVPECQSPLFVVTEIEHTSSGPVAHLYFSAPPEAPTTRSFAAILHETLDGLPVDDILQVPLDLPEYLPLSAVVSPLRLRGLSAMLARIQGQLRRKMAESSAT